MEPLLHVNSVDLLISRTTQAEELRQHHKNYRLLCKCQQHEDMVLMKSPRHSGAQTSCLRRMTVEPGRSLGGCRLGWARASLVSMLEQGAVRSVGQPSSLSMAVYVGSACPSARTAAFPASARGPRGVSTSEAKDAQPVRSPKESSRGLLGP